MFNPTLMNFITASSDEVKIWGTDGKLLRRYRKISDVDLTAMCLDDRMRKFIVGDHAGVIRVFDYLSGALMKRFDYPGWSLGKAHRTEVRSLCYVDEFKSFISSSWDKSIAVHDERFADKGVLLRRILNADRGEITCMDMSRNLSLIVTGSSTSILHLWDFEFVRLEMTCDGKSDGMTAVTFLDPYPAFICADQKGNIEIWGTRPHAKLNGKCLYKFKNLVEGSTTQATAVTTMKVCVTWGRKVGLSKRKATGAGQTFQAEGKSSVSCSDVNEPTLSSTTRGDDIAEDGRDGRKVEGVRLFTGDAKGEIRVWDLMAVIKLLQDRHDFFPLRKKYVCHNPRRGITYDASIDLGDEAKSDGNIEAARSAKRNKESLSKMLSSIQSKRDEDGTFLTSVASSRLSGNRKMICFATYSS